MKNSLKLSLILTIVLFIAVTGIKAQGIEVSGTVTDSETNNTMPGVNILIKGTSQGTSTNGEGYYHTSIPTSSDTLVFTFVGYETREVPINGRNEINVKLKPSTFISEEVVVVGYGVQDAEEITGAVSSIKSEDFVKGTVTDAAQLVKGKIAGLNVTNPNGNPVSTSEISLRGVTTLMSNREPLILIDGVPGGLNEVSPQEIESIDVLKDGSAAAIYGTRGSNGVILITTKDVSGDIPPTLEINSYLNTQMLARTVDFMNAAEYRELVDRGISGAVDQGATTDWMDEVTQRPVSKVSDISLSGGNNATNYVLSLRYSDLNGVMRQTNNQKIQPRLTINHTMLDGKINFDANINGYLQKFMAGKRGRNYNPQVYRQAQKFNPTAPIRAEDGSWFENLAYNAYKNPIGLLQESEGEHQNSRLKLNGTVTVNPVNNLSVRVLASRNYYNSVRGYYETQNHISTVRDGLNGYAARGTTKSQEDLLEVTAEYVFNPIKNHDITLLGGYSWNKISSENYNMTNFDFPSDEFSYNNMGSGTALDDGRATLHSYHGEDKLVSYFSRINYNIDNKYLFMASIRREGSSKFGANNKWASFPAGSIGWNIHNEAFLNDVSFLSELRVRAGFGITGSIPRDRYMSLARLNFGTNAYVNGEWLQTVQPATNPNPNLKWETKEEINIGIDFGFLDNRISGAIDLYERTTKDMLWDYSVPTPPYLYNSITANAASMMNRGIEVQVSTIPVQSKDLQWSSSVNYSTNQNEVLSLSSDKFQLEGGYFYAGHTGGPVQQNTHRVEIGEPIGNFYGYKSIGVDDDGFWIIEGADGNPKPVAQQQADDKQILGNGLPNHYLNWNNIVSYKNFDLSVQMRGAFDFQILNGVRMNYEAPTAIGKGNLLSTAYHDVYGKRPLNQIQEQQYVSYYIEEGDYWKINKVTLGYSFDLNTSYVRQARVYASTTNLYTITGYSGMDPEVSTAGLSPGWDQRARYPATRTFTLGVSLTL